MILIEGSSAAYKEITDWSECNYDQPNHTYFLNDAGKMVGYKISGEDTFKIFDKPLSFYKSGRKFIKLKVTK